MTSGANKKYGIHWFRRDLRIQGNAALRENWKRNKGNVLGLFCFDHSFLSRSDFCANRFAFFLATLQCLQKDMRSMGSDLLVLDVGPQEAFTLLWTKLVDKPALVTWSQDYEPFSKKRDANMQNLFAGHGVETFVARDHLLIEPHELRKGDGSPYKVYTPFANKWLRMFDEEGFAARASAGQSGLKAKAEKVFQLTWSQVCKKKQTFPDLLQHYIDENDKLISVSIPAAGHIAAHKAMDAFEAKLDAYAHKRDFPILQAGSGFSVFLKNGSLSIAQIIARFRLQPYKKKQNGRDTFFSELIWREFYYHILDAYPFVETESFLAKYKDLAWQNNEAWFERWKQGTTGFPIVDAGMRELATTGLMHNRVRMIVASFLCKDLLIDWRWGERYFMTTLLDGDMAPNNGGWQWAASTGCDAQPYFRIFNPWSQSKKFDADGLYIKKYVPELTSVPAKDLHKPILKHASYPEPMVDHAVQRQLALSMYKFE